MKKILIVVGTRPNFIKVTQFRRVASAEGFDVKIVHTGQHSDSNMADIFFESFGLVPDFFLNVSSGSPNSVMGNIMIELEKVINEYGPDIILVAGDVNSTAAAALAANKMQIKLAHIESGLRSFDRTMPEEFNRVVTDALSDYYFVTEQSGYDNLINEGKSKDKIFFAGNTMIDTLVSFCDKIDASDILKKLSLVAKQYVLMTIHRPITVDNKVGLEKLIRVINTITSNYKIVFPIHPRTVKNLKRFNLYESLQNKNLILSEPMDYFSFQKLIKECLFVLTDSGGIQEETTFLKIPCLTLRVNTERPVTITDGTNELIPFDEKIIAQKIVSIENGSYKKGNIPPLWDGKATDRIVAILKEILK